MWRHFQTAHARRLWAARAEAKAGGISENRGRYEKSITPAAFRSKTKQMQIFRKMVRLSNMLSMFGNI